MGKTAFGVPLNDWRAAMLSNSATKSHSLFRYPKPKRTLVNPAVDRDGSSCAYRKAWRSRSEEAHYLFWVIMIPLAVLLIPALGMMVYLILTPDAFTTPITPSSTLSPK